MLAVTEDEMMAVVETEMTGMLCFLSEAVSVWFDSLVYLRQTNQTFRAICDIAGNLLDARFLCVGCMDELTSFLC